MGNFVNSQAKPYDAVACNVDILKHADAPGVTKDKKVKPVKFGPQKKPPVSWYSFLMTEDLASDSDNAENDPTYEPPAEHEDVEDFDSDISLDEIQELAESLKVDIDSLALQYKAEDKGK